MNEPGLYEAIAFWSNLNNNKAFLWAMTWLT